MKVGRKKGSWGETRSYRIKRNFIKSNIYKIPTEIKHPLTIATALNRLIEDEIKKQDHIPRQNLRVEFKGRTDDGFAYNFYEVIKVNKHCLTGS